MGHVIFSTDVREDACGLSRCVTFPDVLTIFKRFNAEFAMQVEDTGHCAVIGRQAHFEAEGLRAVCMLMLSHALHDMNPSLQEACVK